MKGHSSTKFAAACIPPSGSNYLQPICCSAFCKLRPATRVLLQAKGTGRVILISDGLSATGMPDGKYMLGSFEVTMSGGICRNSEGKLAGSTLTLDRALRNVVALGIPLPDAVRMLTANPAKLLGIEFKKGALRIGADADIVLLDENLQVTNVWTRGLPLN